MSNRRNFSEKTYFSFEQCENAMRATHINEFRDAGRRVFGHDGPDSPGEWYEIEEAIEPYSNGILCRKTDGTTFKIFGYNATDAVQNGEPPCKSKS